MKQFITRKKPVKIEFHGLFVSEQICLVSFELKFVNIVSTGQYCLIVTTV